MFLALETSWEPKERMVGKRFGCLNLPPDTSKVVIHIPSLASKTTTEEGKKGISEVAVI